MCGRRGSACRPPPFYSARKLREARFGHAPVWPRDFVPTPYLNSEARETDSSSAVTAEGASGRRETTAGCSDSCRVVTVTEEEQKKDVNKRGLCGSCSSAAVCL